MGAGLAGRAGAGGSIQIPMPFGPRRFRLQRPQWFFGIGGEESGVRRTKLKKRCVGAAVLYLIGSEMPPPSLPACVCVRVHAYMRAFMRACTYVRTCVCVQFLDISSFIMKEHNK